MKTHILGCKLTTKLAMKITKEFEFECAHIVQNATSRRCSHSTHGHSYKCFVTLEGRSLDNAGMIYDFGLFKGTIKEFIDSMDHSLMMYDKSPDEYRDFFERNNERWIEVPFIPSAEMMAVFIMYHINIILSHTIFNNGEGQIKCTSVKLFETRTGSAECDQQDVDELWDENWESIFSHDIVQDWGEDLKSILFDDKMVENPHIKQQVPYIKRKNK